MSMERAARPAQDQAASRDQSAFVEVVVAGWHPGDGNLDSFSLCVLFRDGGARLGAALQLVKRVLDGESVTVRLPFTDRNAAMQALARIGARAVIPELTVQQSP